MSTYKTVQVTKVKDNDLFSSDLFRLKDLLRVCSWFGLICGIGEGIGFLSLQRIGWLDFRLIQLVWVREEILWIAPLSDLFLFCFIGLMLQLLGSLWSRLRSPQIIFCVCIFLTVFDWEAVLAAGRLRHRALLPLAIGITLAINRQIRKMNVGLGIIQRASLRLAWGIPVLLLLVIQSTLSFKEARAEASIVSTGNNLPNIVLIIVDALRADHMSVYGYHRETTPNLSRIASHGALFENAVAPSSWSLPSHTSLFTGRYPHEHGAERMTDYYDGRYKTLADYLRMHGYRTGAFSANKVFFSQSVGLGRGFIHFEDYFNSPLDMWSRTLYGREVWGLAQAFPSHFEGDADRKWSPDVVRSVLKWIDNRPGVPFFAALNLFDVHTAYRPPEPYRSKFVGVSHASAKAEREVQSSTALAHEDDIAAYDGAISYVDEHIDDLLLELQRRGRAENTVVIITADHGESLGEHGVYDHGYELYWELLHVPLIIMWPNHIPEGIRVDKPVTTADLPATVVSLLAIDNDHPFPGGTLSAYWEQHILNTSIFFPAADLKEFQKVRSIVGYGWQYIQKDQKTEVFDLKSDPGELHNLANTAEGQSVAKDLKAELARLDANPRRF